MKSRVEEHIEFQSRINDNPIALLEVLKTLTHDPVRARYTFASMTEALVNCVNVRQFEDENLSDYIKRMKQLRDVLKSHIGDEVLHKFVENGAEYAAETSYTVMSRMKEQSWDQWMAYIAIKGCDQTKYGTVVKGFASQFSLGNDQYPKTMNAVTDVLSNHRFDSRFYEVRDKRREKARAKRNVREDDDTTNRSFNQRVICYTCGEPGHKTPDCTKKDSIPKDRWFINRKISAFQEGNDNDSLDDASEDSGGRDDDSVRSDISSSSRASTSSRNRRSGGNRSRSSRSRSRGSGVEWSGFQYRSSIDYANIELVQGQTTTKPKFDYLKDVIILDSGSTIAGTFMNPDLVSKIRVSRSPIGMATNAGNKKLSLEGQVDGFGTVYYDPSQMANIFGFADTVDKHRVTYDSAKEDAFVVHMSDKTIKFKRTPEGLYAFKPGDSYLKSVADEKSMGPITGVTHMQLPDSDDSESEVSLAISSVSENRKGYTQRQFADAKRARRLYHVIGCPTTENFKHILRQHLIKNCPVTVEDVNIAEKIFGPDIGTLKGKTTRRAPPRVKEDNIEVPPELKAQHRDLVLCIDLMFVNGIVVLTSIDRSIRFRGLVPMKSKTKDEIYKAIDVILRHYNKAGFRIKTIHCDREFKPLMDDVSDEMDAEMNYTAKDGHVPEAERNNRTIGERIRAAYHNLPYKAIPKVMLKYLAMIVTHQLNLFPAKGGISPYFSPHIITGGRAIDYTKHCQTTFGSYVQAVQENNPMNTNAPRTLDCIYLRPLQNVQGGHELLNLTTGLVITRPRVWEIPVTDVVIKAVEKLAADQGVDSLKLQGRTKQILHPADWIAGVEYADENADNDAEDDEYEEIDQDYEFDQELEDEEHYDRVDQDEVDDILSDYSSMTESNPTDSDDSDSDVQDQGEAPAEAEEEADDDSDDDTPALALRSPRPSRSRAQPDRLTYPVTMQTKKQVKFQSDERLRLEHSHNLVAQVSPNPDLDIDYTPQMAMVMARYITDLNERVQAEGTGFAQQYLLNKGIKVFGDRAVKAADKEIGQLHDRTCFVPIDVSNLSHSEKKKAQEGLMFVTEKRDKSIKGRLVYNGKPTREWLSRDDAQSPTVAMESIMLTSVIDAHEGRDIMSADIPNAFIQAHMPETKPGGDRVIMKATGVLVDLLVALAPDTYGSYVVFENGKKVLYLEVLRALYGMLVASLLWYIKFTKDLKKIGFKFNPYDPCVANRKERGKQHTIKFHVDDLMSSHIDPRVNDEFDVWLNKKYGAYGAVKCTRGKIHDYLGMKMDFTEKGKVKVDMSDYIESMVDDFPVEFKPEDIVDSPATEDLFTKDSSEQLGQEQAETFHTFVAKGLFVCKRARPDIHPTTAVLCTRVSKPNKGDWKKLIRMLKYCNGTRKDVLTLSADDLHVIKWYVDASFAVHPDFKGHTGGCMTFGQGVPQSISRKQKLNTRSSTEAELVGADDASVMILWTKLFMEAQGYGIKRNILFQDNKSTILLENNGKRSSSKRTRAFNIRYFFLTDQIEKGNLEVVYCPTTEMDGDFFTKPLQGSTFAKFKKRMGVSSPKGERQECVGGDVRMGL